MTRAEAVQQLEARMTTHIEKFCEQNDDMEDVWCELGYVGEDISRLMAKAAMAVWESSADVQEYLKSEALMD